MNTRTKILIIDDDELNRDILSDFTRSLGYEPILAINGKAGLDILNTSSVDVILLDIVMPVMDGHVFLEELNKNQQLSRIPVIVISAMQDIQSVIKCLKKGAVDYLEKPFNELILEVRIESSLAKKRLQDKEEEHKVYLENFNTQLCKKVQEQVEQITSAQIGTVYALAKLAEYRDLETGIHLQRISEYCNVITMYLKSSSKYKDQIKDNFINYIGISAPLHDIGKVAISDIILLKPGRLSENEYKQMQRHSSIGADALKEILAKYPDNEFIKTAIDIARFHHEKWDGSGYPHKLKGEEIPLSARIVALADVYDALTSKRCYKQIFSEEESRKINIEASEKHFDPEIVKAFIACENKFIEIKNRFSFSH